MSGGWRGPVERQLHDLGRGSVLAHRDGVAGRRLAAHDGQRDRPVRGGDDGRRDAPDLLLAEAQDVAGGGRVGQPQAAQVAVRLAG
jgi:hypothetical protein